MVSFIQGKESLENKRIKTKNQSARKMFFVVFYFSDGQGNIMNVFTYGYFITY